MSYSFTDFTIISGLSGSGKGVALGSLEDIGYYCIDNLPAVMLGELAESLSRGRLHKYATPSLAGIAVSIDARSQQFFAQLEEQLENLKARNIQVRILYIEADEDEIVKRYNETRRRHPLSDWQTPLKEAIRQDKALLSPLREKADKVFDTTGMTPHELRALIRDYTGGAKWGSPLVLMESFGFKFGSPREADFVFDVRCLPNPHWQPELRKLTGLDQPVQEFFSKQEDVQEMITHIFEFLYRWLPGFVEQNRSYITIAIGCTGGQHRSVYVSQQIKDMLLLKEVNAQIRHREL